MHAHQTYSCVLVVVLVASTCAAPLQEKQAKEKKDAAAEIPPGQKVEDQEAQLENLVSLAGEKTKGNNVEVHESHVSHYENKNGNEVKTEQTEEKVTDTKTGKVLADVKQVSETGSDENGNPQKVTETKVDIPDKGVHETFVKNDVDDSVSDEAAEPGLPSVEFSPTAMAKYLLNSYDFDDFYAALKDLVRSSIMSEEEAERYEQEVISEYQRLAAEQSAMEDDFLNDEGYYPAYEVQEKRSDMPPMSEDVQDSMYGLDRAYENYLAGDDFDMGRQALMEESLSGEEESLTNVIDALLNAWWEKDFEGGNTRAMALVSYLYDVVSRDNNPDDIGQIRDILADMLANALLDDVQNAENEYKMQEAVDEAVSESEQNTIAGNTESEGEAEKAGESESTEAAEDELQNVAKVAPDTADEKMEAEASDAKQETEGTSGEDEEEKKSKEEKH